MIGWSEPETPLVDPYEPKEPRVPKLYTRILFWFSVIFLTGLLIHAWTYKSEPVEKYKILKPVDQLEQDYQMIRNAYLSGELPQAFTIGSDYKKPGEDSQ